MNVSCRRQFWRSKTILFKTMTRTNKIGLTSLTFLTLVTLCASTGLNPVNSASNPPQTGSSHLGAFKQLGFDFPHDNHVNTDGRKTPFIPYSISSFNNGGGVNNGASGVNSGNMEIVNSWNEETKAEKFQQVSML